ncbi:hypothetical protein FB451DRAFT_1167611 [Mycena latifolia]|nr:hypothetical protein FB451DRAFT_1167611 [Mycena latifolia]
MSLRRGESLLLFELTNVRTYLRGTPRLRSRIALIASYSHRVLFDTGSSLRVVNSLPVPHFPDLTLGAGSGLGCHKASTVGVRITTRWAPRSSAHVTEASFETLAPTKFRIISQERSFNLLLSKDILDCLLRYIKWARDLDPAVAFDACNSAGVDYGDQAMVLHKNTSVSPIAAHERGAVARRGTTDRLRHRGGKPESLTSTFAVAAARWRHDEYPGIREGGRRCDECGPGTGIGGVGVGRWWYGRKRRSNNGQRSFKMFADRRHAAHVRLKVGEKSKTVNERQTNSAK